MRHSELASQWRHMACYIAMPALLICMTAKVFADSLSFNDALALALRDAPKLMVNAARIDAAREAAIPSGELPDPKLVLGIDNLPINGPDRYSLTSDFMTMRRIGVIQEVPNSEKREARTVAARWRVDVAQAEMRIARLDVLRETAIAWIARDSIEHQLVRIDDLFNENRLFGAAVRAQLAGGKGMTADVVVPRQEAAMIGDRRDEMLARRSQAIASLRRWIGAAAEAPLQGSSPDWRNTRDKLVQDLHQHPELQAFDPKEQVLNAEIAEAKAAKKPDWAIELAYQKRGPQFSDMATLQVSFDLPVFPGSRQDPIIAARLAERAGLDADREATRREHVAKLESDLAEYERLTKTLKRQLEVLLPLADEKTNLAMADWRGGKGSLSVLIAARSERIDAELKAIQLAGERQQTAARLHYAYTEHAEE
jgi:cobalt-zinc-cadmium efflux system outer membrane protein